MCGDLVVTDTVLIIDKAPELIFSFKFLGVHITEDFCKTTSCNSEAGTKRKIHQIIIGTPSFWSGAS